MSDVQFRVGYEILWGERGEDDVEFWRDVFLHIKNQRGSTHESQCSPEWTMSDVIQIQRLS